MPDVKQTHPFMSLLLNAVPENVGSLIDVGCGRGIMGALCRIYREPGRVVGLDAFDRYLDFCKQFNLYDEYVHWNLEKIPLPFQDGEFEAATCIEVIEHLPKEGGERLLEEMERIAGRVIITTPNSYFEQDEYDLNPHQRHLSLWNANDFRKRGYAVIGAGEMKVCGKSVRYISRAFGPLTKYFPSLSTMLLCIKDDRRSRGNYVETISEH